MNSFSRKQNETSINLDTPLPFSGVTKPCLIKKSNATGTLVVLKSALNNFSKHCAAGSNSKVSTSPSAFSGIKSNGSSKSNTNSVLGNNPRSDSKKNLQKPHQYTTLTDKSTYETHPALTMFFISSGGIDASSMASLWAVSIIPWPTDNPPPTMLSHLPKFRGYY